MKSILTGSFARVPFWLLWFMACSLREAKPDDWLTYQHDNRRSASTAESLPASRLVLNWRYASAQPPHPAWDGPAKWDAYAGIRELKSMRNYDPVFHVSAAGQALFFGSSADHSVHCLDARTGREQWTYTTDGPVRVCPSYAGGKLFFGSDDGYAYCVNAGDGQLLWKYSPSPAHTRVLNDGHFIPFWPCRTGVLVDGHTAYFAAGMLPWKESYLCAVDLATGKPEGTGRFVKRLEGVTMEGALLASSDKLISPQGRVAPLLFNRSNGSPLGSLQGGGGCFVLLTEDNRVLHGPGNKTGWVQESRATDRSKIATFNGGSALVVRGSTAYLLTDSALVAIDRATRKELWRRAAGTLHAIILAGDVLFAGGTDSVQAFRTSDGEPLWQYAVAGRAFGLAVADAALFVSTDEGCIYCFRAAAERPGPFGAVPSKSSLLSTNEATLVLAVGPSFQFSGPDRADVWWRTSEPVPTRIEWAIDGEPARVFEDPSPSLDHAATLTNLKRDRVYYYVITGKAGQTALSTARYECDTAFNYSVPPVLQGPSPYSPDALTPRFDQAAEEILKMSGIRQGLCLVMDCGDGRLAYELAKRSELRVVGVDPDPANVAAARRALLQAGVYGARIVIHHAPAGTKLPFVEQFASLIVSGQLEGTPKSWAPAPTVVPYLRPYGGVALFGQALGSPTRLEPEQLEAWLRPAKDARGITAEVYGTWAKLVRGAAPSSGEWSHEYGSAANAAYAGEELGGASSTQDLDVQWLGRPGPRVQADRNGRKPSPLAMNGRLFVQGLHRIIALDAYNGSILWSREIPSLERFNMPRDCGNWCADEESVYVAVADRCWRLEASSGKIGQLYPVFPGTRPNWSYDWGYLSIQGDRLVGSAVKKGSAYTNFWGGSDEGWYDAKYGPATDKVCSENLFALERDSGRAIWWYRGGLLLNSTVTIESGRIYFLEARHPAVTTAASDRIGLPELWKDLWLVGLNLSTGNKVWEQPLRVAPGQVVVYLASGEGKLVLVTSGEKQYRVYTFASADGKSLWQSTFPWPNDNHGRHMARPAVVGNRVYVRPRAFDLTTGRVLDQTVPDGGCGTYAATSKALFFRSGNITVWDLARGTTTSWDRLRPDCWLSTIPAQGLLLSPEAGGGCSCGSWMETSIAFAPRTPGPR